MPRHCYPKARSASTDGEGAGRWFIGYQPEEDLEKYKGKLGGKFVV